jgi:hypothetical protein
MEHILIATSVELVLPNILARMVASHMVASLVLLLGMEVCDEPNHV